MDERLPFERVRRRILVKKEAETNSEYGCNPHKRKIVDLIKCGVVNINKPAGPTSHQVADYVKKILNVKKAGHSGTLDPNVTGCLPTALEDATRIVQVLLKCGKEYIGLMHLHSEVPNSKILQEAENFVGKIKQLPPIKSAVKRQLREREIYYLEILEIEGRNVLFKIGCQAGFYVRKFCNDFGIKLGTKAHMVQLIRTKVGAFSDLEWYTLHDLKDAYDFYILGDESYLRRVIKPFELCVEHLPKIWVLDTSVDSLCHGASLYCPGISKLESNIGENDVVAVLSLKNELVCLGIASINSDEMIKNKKNLAIIVKKVFMQSGSYPKYVATNK